MWPEVATAGASPVNVILYSFSFYVPHVKVPMANFKAIYKRRPAENMFDSFPNQSPNCLDLAG